MDQQLNDLEQPFPLFPPFTALDLSSVNAAGAHRGADPSLST